MRADLISGLLASIRISDWDQAKTDLTCKKTINPWTLQVGSSVLWCKFESPYSKNCRIESELAYSSRSDGAPCRRLTVLWDLCLISLLTRVDARPTTAVCLSVHQLVQNRLFGEEKERGKARRKKRGMVSLTHVQSLSREGSECLYERRPSVNLVGWTGDTFDSDP